MSSHNRTVSALPQAPLWLEVADMIAREIKLVLDDLRSHGAGGLPEDRLHPWARWWPSSAAMAAWCDVNRRTLVKALRHLSEQGVVAKGWLPPDRCGSRGGGPRWIPTEWAARHTRWSVSEIREEILTHGRSGRWRLLPAQRTLAQRFGASIDTLGKVLAQLERERLAVRTRVNEHPRWLILATPLAHPAAGQVDGQVAGEADGPGFSGFSGISAPQRHQVVVADLVRRVQAGEFRYRLSDGVVRERPFPSPGELARQYQTTRGVVDHVRAELLSRDLIVLVGSRGGWRLADHVPAVARRTVPAPRHPRMSRLVTPPARPYRRARDLADDLIRRIRAGEFTDRDFPGPTEVMRRYRAGWGNARAAFDLLHREGWITFGRHRTCRIARLANPLPDTRSDPDPPGLEHTEPAQPPGREPGPTAGRKVTTAVLPVLAGAPWPLTLRELCAITGLDSVGLTEPMRRLLEYGWVVRVDNPRHDPRQDALDEHGGWAYAITSDGYDLVAADEHAAHAAGEVGRNRARLLQTRADRVGDTACHTTKRPNVPTPEGAGPAPFPV